MINIELVAEAIAMIIANRENANVKVSVKQNNEKDMAVVCVKHCTISSNANNAEKL